MADETSTEITELERLQWQLALSEAHRTELQLVLAQNEAGKARKKLDEHVNFMRQAYRLGPQDNVDLNPDSPTARLIKRVPVPVIRAPAPPPKPEPTAQELETERSAAAKKAGDALRAEQEAAAAKAAEERKAAEAAAVKAEAEKAAAAAQPVEG